jgi:hypothetical protein
LCLRASQEYGDDGLGRDDVKDFFNDVYPSIRSATTAEDSFLLWYLFRFHFFLLSPLDFCVRVAVFAVPLFPQRIRGDHKHFL